MSLILKTMEKQTYQFTYQVLPDASGLGASDAELLRKARTVTSEAYAPYSRFRVSAVARLANGAFVSGTNQENASYPVGICAERSLLATAASLHPGVAVETIAISYQSDTSASEQPITPCGMCRQALLEYERRTHHPIRLILAGQNGPVWVIEAAHSLLPLAFTGEEFGAGS